MTKPKPLRKIGNLDAIEIPGQVGGYCIVVFHGYGADANDLLSLSRILAVPPGTTWLFPQGPLKVSDGGIAGRAWFPIDVEALDAAMREGTHRDMSNITPPGLKQAREAALSMLTALQIPMTKTIIAGFSQGAMLATEIALRSSEKPLGLVILSGNMINKDVWKEKAKTKAGMPFFQSHGDADALLGFQYAQDLEKFLIDEGLKGQLHAFRGGHEVPQEIIYKLNQFFKKTMGSL